VMGRRQHHHPPGRVTFFGSPRPHCQGASFRRPTPAHAGPRNAESSIKSPLDSGPAASASRPSRSSPRDPKPRRGAALIHSLFRLSASAVTPATRRRTAVAASPSPHRRRRTATAARHTPPARELCARPHRPPRRDGRARAPRLGAGPLSRGPVARVAPGWTEQVRSPAPRGVAAPRRPTRAPVMTN
jgi:hypothetical protein